eukprot:8808912-Lingulodinium_polyedra.AAC.1
MGPPPPDILESCRSVLWVIDVRSAVQLARGALQHGHAWRAFHAIATPCSRTSSGAGLVMLRPMSWQSF